MTQLSDLPAPERAERYRDLAREADRMASCTGGTVREAYEQMAKQWRRLADETDPRI
jgi:hypothetical protein